MFRFLLLFMLIPWTHYLRAMGKPNLLSSLLYSLKLQERPQQKEEPCSLRVLPLDVLDRIAEFLVPVPQEETRDDFIKRTVSIVQGKKDVPVEDEERKAEYRYFYWKDAYYLIASNKKTKNELVVYTTRSDEHAFWILPRSIPHAYPYHIIFSSSPGFSKIIYTQDSSSQYMANSYNYDLAHIRDLASGKEHEHILTRTPEYSHVACIAVSHDAKVAHVDKDHSGRAILRIEGSQDKGEKPSKAIECPVRFKGTIISCAFNKQGTEVVVYGKDNYEDFDLHPFDDFDLHTFIKRFKIETKSKKMDLAVYFRRNLICNDLLKQCGIVRQIAQTFQKSSEQE